MFADSAEKVYQFNFFPLDRLRVSFSRTFLARISHSPEPDFGISRETNAIVLIASHSPSKDSL